MTQYLHYLSGFFYQPHVVIKQLKNDRNAVPYGVSSLMLISLLYMATSAALYFSPIECCVIEPFVKVPADVYWLVQIIWEIPLMFILAIIPAALVEIFTDRQKRESDFKQLFACMGFIVIVVQLINMWFPETIMAIVGRNDFLPPVVNSLRVYIFIPWLIFLFTLSVKEIKALSWVRSVLLAFLTTLPGMIIVMIFVR